MKNSVAGLVISVVGLLTACGGGGSSSENSLTDSAVSIRFSDAPVSNAEKVVITVDSMHFDNVNGETISVDTFTSDELGITNAETFIIDLLEVQGNENRLVLDSVKLPIGEYKSMRLGIVDEDINFSFVEEVDSGLLKPIKVPSNELKLGAFTVAETSIQTFVVEFGLRHALTYNPGPERYILKPRGVRVVGLEDAASLGGVVDLDAVHADSSCSGKVDQTVGNVAYLYAGHGLATDLLGDVFVREDASLEDVEFDPDVPADTIAPVAATSITTDSGEYLFSYLFPGDYTLAITCLAENDDPVIHDQIIIPSPSTEVIELSIGNEEDAVCNFPLDDGFCASE